MLETWRDLERERRVHSPLEVLIVDNIGSSPKSPRGLLPSRPPGEAGGTNLLQVVCSHAELLDRAPSQTGSL